eukprot:3922759-Prymnesium_polylepis.1
MCQMRVVVTSRHPSGGLGDAEVHLGHVSTNKLRSNASNAGTTSARPTPTSQNVPLVGPWDTSFDVIIHMQKRDPYIGQPRRRIRSRAKQPITANQSRRNLTGLIERRRGWRALGAFAFLPPAIRNVEPRLLPPEGE